VSTQLPVPILLVGGFLGSGKTTLMRRLIVDAQARELKIAVIVNEFGATDIDSNILRELERETANEILTGIAGGCACCTGQDELHWTLLEIGERSDETRPDIILMEASGVADPILLLDVATAAQLLPLVRPSLLVGVVDVERYGEMQADVAPLLRRQVQMADVILLNKIDLVSQAQIEASRNELAQLNSHARIEVTAHCEVDCGALWQRALCETQGDDAQRVLRVARQAAKPVPHTHFQTVICPLPHPMSALVLKRRCKACRRSVAGQRVRAFTRRGAALAAIHGRRCTVSLSSRAVSSSGEYSGTGNVGGFHCAALDRNTIMQSFRSSLLTMLY
jgi:G3E family GTPase